MNVFPVIHYARDDLARENAKIAFECGCPGIFLIHMSGDDELLWEIARELTAEYPHRKIGVNLLGQTSPSSAILNTLEHGLNMLWLDRCGVSSRGISYEAIRASEMLHDNPEFTFFGSVAFKYQTQDPDPGLAALNAYRMGFIPTTSGDATGEAASEDKLAAIYDRIQDARWAVASGVDASNIKMHKKYCTDVLVSTKISKSFYEFDREKLEELMKELE